MKINKNKLTEMISKSMQHLINEGAGAGYDVTFEGLNADDIVITGSDYVDKRYTDEVFKFTANIVPGLVEWKAVGYYDGVTSEGIYYNNDLVDEITESEKTVNGGTVEGYVYKQDVEDFAGDEINEQDVIEYIKSELTDFSFTTMYGGGWSHVNLDDPMVFDDRIAITNNYNVETLIINRIIIKAHDITDIINWYFDNCDNFDEIYGNNDEEQGLQESMKQTIKLNESQLRQMIHEALNELDWKTYANASKKAYQWRQEHPFQYDRNRGLAFDNAAQDAFKQQLGIDNQDSTNYGGEKGNINMLVTHGEPEISGSRNHDFQDKENPFDLKHNVYHMSKKYGKDGKYGRTRMWDIAHETTPEEFYGDEEMGKKYRNAEQEVDNYKNGKYQYDNEKGWHLNESKLDNIIKESIKKILNEK